MNIWIISNYEVPSEYAVRTRTHNMAKYIMNKGHKVTIFASSTIHNTNFNINVAGTKYLLRVDCEGIEFVHIRTQNYKNKIQRIINNLQFIFGLRSIIKHFSPPDIILVSFSPFYLNIPYKIAKQFKCPIILEVRDLWPESFIELGLIKRNNPLVKLAYMIEKYNYEKADKIVFSFEGGKDYVKEKEYGKVNPDKIYYINHGINLDEFYHNQANFIIADEDLDNDGFFKVLFTGSIRDIYDIPFILETAKIIKQRHHDNIKIILYGTGPKLDFYREKCLNEGIDNVFFKGYIEKKYIPYILSKGNVNLLHTKRSNLLRFGHSNNKSFEYYASGKPIISTLKANYDPINKYNCGIIVNDYNPESLANTIIRMSKATNEELKKLGQNSLEAAKEYDIQRLLQEFYEVLNC